MTTPGNALANQGDYATGLEDLTSEDLRIPRLTINHEEGTFKDSLSGSEFEAITVIPLGLVKQRVLWHPNVDETATVPLCKSTDFNTGFPTTTQPRKQDNFPWEATGWTMNDFQPGPDGRITLPCQTCRLKEWASHPDGKKTWCSEQHTIPLLYGEESQPPAMSALFTAQRSSIQASKNFFAGIARQNLPAYAFVAKVTLKMFQRGKNKYYVPVFMITGRTDQDDWTTYSDNYRSIREFLHRPPLMKDSEGNVVNAQNVAGSNVISGQATWAPGATPAPAPAQQPVQQAWAPTPQQAPPMTPVQQAPPAPPAPPMAPPAAPVMPFPSQGSTSRDDDDLPF